MATRGGARAAHARRLAHPAAGRATRILGRHTAAAASQGDEQPRPAHRSGPRPGRLQRGRPRPVLPTQLGGRANRAGEAGRRHVPGAHHATPAAPESPSPSPRSATDTATTSAGGAWRIPIHSSLWLDRQYTRKTQPSRLLAISSAACCTEPPSYLRASRFCAVRRCAFVAASMRPPLPRRRVAAHAFLVAAGRSRGPRARHGAVRNVRCLGG